MPGIEFLQTQQELVPVAAATSARDDRKVPICKTKKSIDLNTELLKDGKSVDDGLERVCSL